MEEKLRLSSTPEYVISDIHNNQSQCMILFRNDKKFSPRTPRFKLVVGTVC